MPNPTVFERKLRKLNLYPINYLLANSTDGPRWSLDQIQQVEKWYRRFHQLVSLYPSHQIVPTKHVDEYWHQHILDTEKYYSDCIKLHGRIIHHFPYLGIENRTSLVALYEVTLSLFEETYGESPVVLKDVFRSTDRRVGRRSVDETYSEASLCGSACIKTCPSKRGSFDKERIPAIAGISDALQ